MPELPDSFAAPPVVYAVGRDYQIMVPVTCETLMWVRIGEEDFFDDDNGILRSRVQTHRMTVPSAVLDRAGKYTLCFRKVLERLPYFSKTGEVGTFEVAFRPIEKDVINFYHIADAHNRIEGPVSAGKFFGKALDLLVLNGDIPDHSGQIENFAAIHRIAGEITGGAIPVVFSRGNHDMRGIHAENLSGHTPSDRGNSYYTFRLGPLWGVVLDCGEDKNDEDEAYGHTVCCHAFRLRETKFLEQITARAADEYAAPGVKYRLVFSHFHFTENDRPPHDIESGIFSLWCRLLRENVRPQAMLFGHVHENYITRPGDPRDHKGQGCPVIVSGIPDPKAFDLFSGAAVTLSPEGIRIRFTDQGHRITGEDFLPTASPEPSFRKEEI